MRILITGATGFIGKNLISVMETISNIELFKYSREMKKDLLEEYIKQCDFIVHLAGVVGKKVDREFWNGNYKFTCELLEIIKRNKRKIPIIMSSSIQVELDNEYGKSKRAAEIALVNYSLESGANVYIYRLSNVFGKWALPNNSSVVATFCNNIANNLPIAIIDPEKKINLIYIDDVIKSIIEVIEGKSEKKPYYTIYDSYEITINELANIISGFKDIENGVSVPNMSKIFIKNLYSTYLSYLPKEKLCHTINSNKDIRGSFTEILKSTDVGQVSVNICKVGTVKGNHWHKTKCEKFIVVKGSAIIQLRKVGTKEILYYHVDEENINVVEIPPGFIHNLINVGKEDLVTIIWCNEIFDNENPDTYYEEV